MDRHCKNQDQPEIGPNGTESFLLGDKRFSLKNNQLYNEQGDYLSLRSQAGAVLACLIRDNGQVVSKEKLHQEVWGEAIVTDDSLVQCIGEIRKTLNDKDRRIIQTFPRKGYLVNAKPAIEAEKSQGLHTVYIAKDRNSRKWTVITGALITLTLVLSVFSWLKFSEHRYGLGDKPKIAVLPFSDLSVGEHKDYLSDAIAEGVLSEMARHQFFDVIAKNSSFRYRDNETDVRQISQDLGVHYILEGSQQIEGDDLKVTVRLVDAAKATNMWSNTYDVELGDLFIVQDKIVKTVSDRIGRKIQRPVPGRDSRKVSALHYHLQARQLMNLKVDAENNKKAIELNELAVKADPDSHYGYLGLARAYRKASSFAWHGMTKKEALAIGFENAYKALDIAPESPDVHFVLGQLHTNRSETNEALSRLAKAIELNPSNSNYLAYSATPLLYTGKTDEAIERLERAMGVDPFHPEWFHWSMGWALWEKENCEGGLTAMKRMTKIPQQAHRMLSVLYACLGEEKKAQDAYNTFKKDLKELTIAEERALWEDVWTAEGSIDRWLDHLRIAGMKD